MIGFIIGLALFGSVTYLPLYLQIVKGASPTASGLQLLPLMAGVIASSIGSGLLITRFGRYKVFPIVGTALMTVGLFLLSRLEVGTSILADRPLHARARPRARVRDAGPRARGAELRRVQGPRRCDVGRDVVPVDGRHDRRLDLRGDLLRRSSPHKLAASFPHGLPAGSGHPIPSVIDKLPPAIHEPYVNAFAEALHPVFLAATGIAVALVRAHLVPARAAAARDRRRPAGGRDVPREPLRPAARRELATRGREQVERARPPREPPLGLRGARRARRRRSQPAAALAPVPRPRRGHRRAARRSPSASAPIAIGSSPRCGSSSRAASCESKAPSSARSTSSFTRRRRRMRFSCASMRHG